MEMTNRFYLRGGDAPSPKVAATPPSRNVGATPSSPGVFGAPASRKKTSAPCYQPVDAGSEAPLSPSATGRRRHTHSQPSTIN